jgi:predicted RNase H-like nuclease (RuvC/YqgF family)
MDVDMSIGYGDESLNKGEDGSVEYLTYMIRNAVEAFEIEGDLRTWDDITNGAQQIERLRQEPLEREEAILEQLKSQAKDMDEMLRRNENNPNRLTERSELRNMTQQKYEVAREINQLEEENTTESLRLKHLKNSVEQLESANPIAESLSRPNAAMNALKLRLYRSLGIKADHKTGRVLVISPIRRSVNVVFSRDGQSACEIADDIWSSL